MTMVYRTAGTWGAGKGSNLTAAEVDGNFYDLDTRIADIEANPVQPVQIESIVSTGSAITITMDNGDVYGPLSIAAATIDYRDEWLPSTDYKTNDIVIYNGGEVYYIAVDHTSALTFDPTRVVTGRKVYNLMFDVYPLCVDAAGWALASGVHTGISFIIASDGSVEGTIDFDAGYNSYVNAVGTALSATQSDGINFTHAPGDPYITAAVDSGWVGEVSLDWLVDALTRGNHTGITWTYDDNASVGLGSLSATVSVSFNDLADAPSSYAGEARKLLAVRDDETGIEFIDANELVPVAAIPRFMGAQVNLSASTSAQNYSAGTSIAFASEQYDTDAFHDAVTNNNRLTIPAGLGIKKVRLYATVRVSSITAGSDNFLAIRKGGAENYLGSAALHHENSGATSTTITVASQPISVVDGDWFDCWFSTSDTSTGLEADRTSFAIEVVEVEGGINIASVPTESSTTRTLAIADINAHILCTSAGDSAGDVTITVPANATVAFPIGASIDIEQNGAGQVSITGAGGVTINKPSDKTAATRGQYSVLRLRKVATNTWTLSGDMA